MEAKLYHVTLKNDKWNVAYSENMAHYSTEPNKEDIVAFFR